MELNYFKKGLTFNKIVHIITIKECANNHTRRPDQVPGQRVLARAIDGLFITCHRKEAFSLYHRCIPIKRWGMGLRQGYLRGPIVA
jgi:hypothetical protein